MITAFLEHLVISTAFAILVAGIVWIRNTDGPAFRYRLWLAAALKFGIPTSIFGAFGAWVHQIGPKHVIARATLYPPSLEAINHVSRVFSDVSAGHNSLWRGFAVIWPLGAVSCLLLWIMRMKSQRPSSREASEPIIGIVSKLCGRMGLGRRVIVRSTVRQCDLAVYGVFKSVILIPAGFDESLEPAELEAILAHELAHVRRWDNLAAVVVHALTCIFWFHPALWWIERRLIVERELACDEAVVDQGWPAKSYAAGILKLCRFQFTDLRAGACGFSNSSLQQRMEQIMSYTSRSRKERTRVVLGVLGAMLTLVPATIGFLHAHSVYAQSGVGQEKNVHRAITCSFADKHYPEGVIIHQEGGHQQMCVESFGKPLWVRTSPETRQRGQAVIEVPAPTRQASFCIPRSSTSKGLCSCEGGGIYSPGSIVDSPSGQLSCSAGHWDAFHRTKK
jgi:bla regulator protein BlaR1